MSENYSASHQYTIQQLSEKLNIPKPTLRFWEKELEGIIVPLRTPGRQRRYTNIHFTVLEKIKNLRDSGKSIPDIKEYFNNGHSNQGPTDNDAVIEILTEKIAELVKMELIKFLKIK